MARPQRPLDPEQGPMQAFADELRELHKRAGAPKYLQMSRKTGKSRTAMSEAVGGDHLPSWETVAAFVKACEGSPADWRPKWEAARDARATARQEEARHEEAQAGEAPAHTSSSMSERRWSRRIVEYALIVIVTAVVSTLASAEIFVGTRRDPNGTKLVAHHVQREAIIVVQDKVALGSNSLIEDTTPAYLSSKRIPFCSHYGCELPGTQVSSGAMLVAVCYAFGAEMYNYNLDSTASEDNPYRASSRLWYKVLLPDQRSGYISEVYIVAADRGGRRLPRCQ